MERANDCEKTSTVERASKEEKTRPPERAKNGEKTTREERARTCEKTIQIERARFREKPRVNERAIDNEKTTTDKASFIKIKKGGITQMSFNLESISNTKQIRAPRMLLLGVEKIGKTTFACGTHFENGQIVATGLNSPVVIPLKGEEGADALEVGQFPVCQSYNDVLDAIGALFGDHEYKTVVIDSASALEPLVWDAVCNAGDVSSIEKYGGGYGKGYTEAVSYFRELLEGLDGLRNEKGMASIIIGHVKVKRFDDPGGDSYDQYQFDIHDKASNLLYRWADLILFSNTKVVVKKEDTGFGKEKKRGIDCSGGQRFLFTQKRPAHPGGGRGVYGQLPYELPLDYSVFESAVADIISKGGNTE